MIHQLVIHIILLGILLVRFFFHINQTCLAGFLRNDLVIALNHRCLLEVMILEHLHRFLEFSELWHHFLVKFFHFVIPGVFAERCMDLVDKFFFCLQIIFFLKLV